MYFRIVMEVYRNVNSILESNTYILSNPGNPSVVIIDPGDVGPLFKWLELKSKFVSSIILTHSHYDHIYGLNDLISAFPNLTLYIQELTISGLFCDKENLSVFFGSSFVLEEKNRDNIIVLNSMDRVRLWDEYFFSLIVTPGHTCDSVSILVRDYLFCGDALIPGKKVFKVKGSDLEDMKRSNEKILSLSNSELLLLPGHGEKCYLKDLSSSLKYSPVNNVKCVFQIC